MDGIINVYKPAGITSFDVVRILRRVLKTKKIGHTGTLDPLAKGVLVICVGRTTKLASIIEAKSKSYLACMDFGYSTDTYDIEGKITNRGQNIKNKEDFIKILRKYQGEQYQIPPMYSALKVNGKKLYELARENIVIERKKRKIIISKIESKFYSCSKAVIDTTVSKGTYIRTLIDDIGHDLNSFATMTSLTRIFVGDYHIKNSFHLEDIKTMVENEDLSFLISVESSFSENNSYQLSKDKDITLFKNGNTVLSNNLKDGIYRIYNEELFLGLAQVVDNRLKGYKYF